MAKGKETAAAKSDNKGDSKIQADVVSFMKELGLPTEAPPMINTVASTTPAKSAKKSDSKTDSKADSKSDKKADSVKKTDSKSPKDISDKSKKEQTKKSETQSQTNKNNAQSTDLPVVKKPKNKFKPDAVATHGKAHTRFTADGEEEYDPNVVEEVPESEASKQSSEMQALVKKASQNIGERQRWFDIKVADIPNRVANAAPLPRAKIEELRLTMDAALHADATAAESSLKNNKRHASADDKFLATVLQSGTVSDKVAAMTLVVQQAPHERINVLDSLMTMAKKKGRRESMMAIDALKDLFLSDLLPAQRKLKFFYQQPLTFADFAQHSPMLKMQAFEDAMKRRYLEFCSCLERGASDEMEYYRSKILSHIYELLCAAPEGEQILLQLLVNKLADTTRKVASKASYLLTQLLQAHSAMKGVVINELNLFLHRANLSGRAQYYAIVFLNQLLFVAGSPSDEALAQRLIKLYFSLFQSQVSMISTEKEERETNTKAKRREIINKLRNLEQQGKSSKGGKKDSKDKKDKSQDKEKQQLTTALKSLRRGADDARAEIESNHAKLMGALLAGVNRAYPYANFNDDEFEHHATELFRIVHGHNFNLAVQALQFLFQVMRSRATLSDRFYRALYEKLMTVEARTSGKHALFLNLLFKSMKHDTSIPRITAFLKRLLQVCLHAATSFVCGSLILTGEIVRLHPEVRERIVSPQPKAPENVDERDAHGYDASKRDPIHANANLSCLWELNQLKDHFHPSVSHFAKCIIDGQAIEYLGDPLADFTTIAFLDRFMYKNPKQLDKESGGVMALRARRAARPQLFAAHSAQYLTLHPSLIPEDERFLRQYFESKAARDTGTQVKEQRSDGDFDFDGDEDPEEAAFANELMEKEMQKMHGKFDDDEDDDIDYEDALGSQEGSDDEGLGDEVDGDDDEVTFPKYIKTGAGDDESDSDMSDLPDGDSDDDNEDDEGVDTIMLSDDDEEAAAMAEAGLDDDISMKALKQNKKRKQQESDDDSEDDALRRAFDQDDDSDDAFNSKAKKGKKKGKSAGSDDEEEYQSVDRKNKKKKASSSFADADEFAALLDGGGASAGDMKHNAWERKKEFGGQAKRGRGGRGGSRGGRSFRK